MLVSIDLPEKYFIQTQKEQIAHQLKLSLALGMYRKGEISIGGACELAGVNHYDFMKECKDQSIPLNTFSAEDLEEEWKENQRLLNRINAANADFPDEQEEKMMKAMKEKQPALFEDEGW